MYTARAKDFCAGFDLGVVTEDPQNNRVENKHFVQLKIPKHFLSCLKTMLEIMLDLHWGTRTKKEKMVGIFT